MSAHRAEAQVSTANASKYLQQLCKHFQHKLPASFDAHAGAITFPFGETKFAADEQTLNLAVEAASEEDLEKLKDVVVRHLVRFAFREEINVHWREATKIAGA
jgi:uncharacterized protein